MPVSKVTISLMWRWVMCLPNLMIPDFPHNIKIRLAKLKLFFCFILTLLCLCPVGCLSNVRTKQNKILIGPILSLYYEESLVSSNLNSKQLRFHGVRPNVLTNFYAIQYFIFENMIKVRKRFENIWPIRFWGGFGNK